MKIDPWLNDPEYKITLEDKARIRIKDQDLDALAMK